MAYTLASGSSQYVEQTAIPSGTWASDFTVGLWVNYTGAAGVFKVALSSKSTGATGWQLFYRHDGAAVLRYTYLGIADYTTSIASPTGWAFLGVSKRAADTDVYAQTTKENIGTGTMNAPDTNGIVIGARHFNSAYSLHFDGGVAECAVWNDDLTTPEMTALARGYSPLLVRPGNLIAYIPLVRALQDPRSGGTVQTSGSPSVATHAPMIYPKRRQVAFAPAAAGGLSIPVASHYYRQRRIA